MKAAELGQFEQRNGIINGWKLPGERIGEQFVIVWQDWREMQHYI